jgi:hypothetical protein
MKKLALIITISLVIVLVASAQTKSADATVFGLHLGAKFSLPECARSTTGDAGVLNYDYRSEPSSPCFPRACSQRCRSTFTPRSSMGT